MKTLRIYLISLLIITFSTSGFSFNLIITGQISDINSGMPIENQMVEVFIDSIPGTSGYYNTVYTDLYGMYYDSVELQDSTSGIVTISIDSCNYYIHRNHWFSINSTYIYDTFLSCTANGNQCDAFFTYYPANQPTTIQFLDESVGYIETYLWDFGDGAISYEQNPVHTYPDWGQYLTTLTITGDSCFSIYSMIVNVLPDSSDCEAMFTYFQLPMSATVEFIDLSTGDISDWQWDFGDGQTSFEQNPVHIYEYPGIYSVSLNITTYDSCISSFTESIWITQDTLNCQADFSYSLDTLNNTPHTYIFQDKSTNNTQMWYWDFGDGKFSTESSPVHIYEQPGTYTVCLNITTMEGGNICTSTYCDTIVTINYFNFGGQAFIGDYPINIDSTDKDNICTVYLYRKIANSWQYMDQREFWKYGYYWFSNKPQGEYLLLAELSDISAEYENYAPSYFPDASSWKYAGIFDLQDNNQFAVNIHFNELIGYESGTGIIEGNVLAGNSCHEISGLPLNDIMVQLKNINNDVLAFTYTNDEGYYSFNGLGTNNYVVHAEYPGRYSEALNVGINSINNFVDKDLIVHCSHILGLEEVVQSGGQIITELYPNPASENVNIIVTTEKDVYTNIVIISTNGRVMYDNNHMISSDNNEININAESFNQGYYLIILKDLTSGFQTVNKLSIIK